jgi:hypothetical protein
VPAGQTQNVTINLARWTNQSTNGWFSGDTHIHLHYGQFDTGAYASDYPSVDLPYFQTMIDAEDLNVGNTLYANSGMASPFTYDQALFTAAPVTFATNRISFVGEEFRSPEQGHLVLLNLTSLVTPPYNNGENATVAPYTATANPYTVPTLDDVADAVHAQNAGNGGGMATFAHPCFGSGTLSRTACSALELPILAANRRIDSMDVLHTLANETLGLALYYKLLNTRNKIAITGATDAELDKLSTGGQPIGSDRVYVKLDPPLTYAKWIAGIKARRTFATNGPMLDLTVTTDAGARTIGDTIDLGAAAVLPVTATARSRYPIGIIEIVRNGVVVGTIGSSSSKQTTITGTVDVSVSEPSWIAARVIEDPSSPDLVYETQIFAHTSPVWVNINSEEVDVKTDAAFLRDEWCDFYVSLMSSKDATTQMNGQTNKDRAIAQGNAAWTYYDNLSK